MTGQPITSANGNHNENFNPIAFPQLGFSGFENLGGQLPGSYIFVYYNIVDFNNQMVYDFTPLGFLRLSPLVINSAVFICMVFSTT